MELQGTRWSVCIDNINCIHNDTKYADDNANKNNDNNHNNYDNKTKKKKNGIKRTL